jgi:hypothetical protein
LSGGNILSRGEDRNDVVATLHPDEIGNRNEIVRRSRVHGKKSGCENYAAARRRERPLGIRCLRRGRGGSFAARETGRYAFFNKEGYGGLIVWHRTGPRPGQSFEVHGCMHKLYQSLGGTGSWLGFPIGDEYDVPEGRRSDFENGNIFWDAQTRVCQARKYSEGANMTVEPDIERLGSDYRDFDLPQPGYEACREACAGEANCKAYTYVKSGIQALNARCWLKSSVADPVPSPCCVSGVRQ